QPQARLGRLLIGLGQLREARAALEASRRADPSLLAPTLSLARLAQQEGSLAEARGLYQSMLSNDATSLEALIGLASVEAADRHPDAAAAALEKAVEAHPDHVIAR